MTMQNAKRRCCRRFLIFFQGLLIVFIALPSLLYAGQQDGKNEFKDLPPALHAALEKAESFAARQQFQKAQNVLEAYAVAHPAQKHPLLYYETGYFAYKARNLEAAISNLKKNVAVAAAYKDGWQLLSLAWQESGARYSKEKKEEKPKRLQAMQQSALAMDRAAALAKDDDLLYQSAMLWLEADKAKKALGILERLSQKSNPKQEWLLGLAEALKALKKTEETAEAMEKAARLRNDPGLLFHAAWLWNDLEKPRRALPLLTMLAERKNPEKNWLLLLAGVYNTLQRYSDAAATFERIIEIDPAPDYLYNCGVLWLQASKIDRALRALVRLKDVTPPKAEWFVATAQAWLLKEDIPKAADAMERAAGISKKAEHIYQAGSLRLQLREADRAIRLLTPLTKRKKPKSKWFVALSNAWLLKEDYVKGATYMEQAAEISGQGRLYHRAGMLWRVVDKLDKTIVLLRKSVAVKKVEQLWLVDLASVLLDANRESEVRPVMKRTRLSDAAVSNSLRYRGVVVWLNINEPAKAYPLLRLLSKQKNPEYSWLSSLVKICVELGKMQEADKALQQLLNGFPSRVGSWKLAVWLALQQGSYADAVAAKEIVRQFEPNEKKHLKDLSRLYLLAGVPQQAAKLHTRFIGKKPDVEQLEHLVDIYLSGQRYEEALSTELQVAKQQKNSEHFEILGTIYYALHRYDESCGAYEHAAELCAEINPDLLMKAAYSAMKERQYERAAKNFNKVVVSGAASDEQMQAASQNLAYIERMQKLRSF